MFSFWSNIISRIEELLVAPQIDSQLLLVFAFFHVLAWIFIFMWVVFFDLGLFRNAVKTNKFVKNFIKFVKFSNDGADELKELILDLTNRLKLATLSNTYNLHDTLYKKGDDLDDIQKKMEIKSEELALFWENEFRRRMFFAKIFSRFYKNISFIRENSNLNFFRYHYRMSLSTLRGFYKNFSSTLENSYDFLKHSYLAGLTSFWLGFRVWSWPLILSLFVFYYLMVNRCLPFTKTMFVWIVVAMFAYWLLSGFVFFIKKYQFSKFTSAIQRFWRRSYILFWLIEFSLFSVFFYLTLNSNNESWYMYDQLQVFKTGLFSWRSFVMKLFPLTLLIIFGYLLLLSLKWNVFTKHTLWLLVLTILLIYIVWLEFYQFFHAVNFYGNFSWVFDVDEKVWSLELETRKSRTVNHYVMLMIMLKFWHIVVIFIIWVFFLLRILEIGRIRYPLFSANLNNFIILYLFAWVLMFPWFKFIFRKYLDMPYYWFYVNNRRLGYRVFFNDISIFYYGLTNFIYYNFVGLKNMFELDFFYFSQESDMYSFRKTFVKNLILSRLTDI
jgi:hypothetical protein